jgi:dCTP deaminase
MSLLTHNELVALVESGAIENVKPEQISGASIDLTLADGYMLESVMAIAERADVYLGEKQAPRMIKRNGTLRLAPGGFALAATQQIFHLPNNIAGHYMLKSSLARAGLNHLFAGWADPTWHGSALTLELHNVLRYHTLILKPGDPCGQMVFWRGEPVPDHASYARRGQYNRQPAVQESKGTR